MDTLPEIISVGETIHRFGIGRTKLYELIRDGEIVAMKLGRRTLICTATVRAFIECLPRLGPPT